MSFGSNFPSLVVFALLLFPLPSFSCFLRTSKSWNFPVFPHSVCIYVLKVLAIKFIRLLGAEGGGGGGKGILYWSLIFSGWKWSCPIALRVNFTLKNCNYINILLITLLSILLNLKKFKHRTNVLNLYLLPLL